MLKFCRNIFCLFLLIALVACSQNSSTTPPSAQFPVHNPNLLQAVLNDSMLVVTAVKDGNIPVKGSFLVSSGKVEKTSLGDWQLQVSFDPKTWNTGLALRDERVRGLFFQVAKMGFENIRFEASGIADAVVQNVRMGSEQIVTVQGTLFFAGQQKNITFNVSLKLENGFIVVNTVEPIVISIADWGLEPAKQALIKECKHREIQDTINVTFAVKFE